MTEWLSCTRHNGYCFFYIQIHEAKLVSDYVSQGCGWTLLPHISSARVPGVVASRQLQDSVHASKHSSTRATSPDPKCNLEYFT